MKLAGRKSVLNPRWFTLLNVLRRWSRCLCCFVVYSTRRFVNLIAFRTFVRFVLVWICLFPLPLGVWEGLRFVKLASCKSDVS